MTTNKEGPHRLSLYLSSALVKTEIKKTRRFQRSGGISQKDDSWTGWCFVHINFIGIETINEKSLFPTKMTTSFGGSPPVLLAALQQRKNGAQAPIPAEKRMRDDTPVPSLSFFSLLSKCDLLSRNRRSHLLAFSDLYN